MDPGAFAGSPQQIISDLMRRVRSLEQRLPGGTGVSTTFGATNVRPMQVGFPAELTAAWDATDGYAWKQLALDTSVMGLVNPSVQPAGVGAVAVNGDETLASGTQGWMELDPSAGGYLFVPVGGGASPLTTKGDVYTRTSSADARLPVGANGLVLTTDSTTSTGLKWAAGVTAGGGGTAGSYVQFAADNVWYSSLDGTVLPAAGSYVVTLCASVYGNLASGGPGLIDVILYNSTAGADIGLSRRVTVETVGVAVELQVVITAKVTVTGATSLYARGRRNLGGAGAWADAGFFSFSGSPIMISWVSVT